MDGRKEDPSMRSTHCTGKGRAPDERGNALIVALLILFLLTSLGITYVAITKGDKQITGNQVASTQAFTNAEAGVTEVLHRMSNPSAPGTQYIGETPPTVTPGWGRYVVNVPGSPSTDPQYDATTSDGVDNNGNAAVDESSEHYPETGSWQSNLPVSQRLNYPWVKVRYKLNAANQVLLFGDDDNNPFTPPRENLVRGVPEIVVTAEGMQGVGQKLVTVEAVKYPLPPIPGSVYTEGSMNFAGNSFYIDGHDHAPTAPYDTIPNAASLPGIATPNDPTSISTQLNPQQQDNVEGSGTDPSVQSSSVNLDLQAMADAWDQVADITYPGNLINPSAPDWGNINNLKIVHVAGDLTINGSYTGAGVLIIDGDFHMGGTLNWSGLVICLGDVDVTGGGSAKNIVGAMLVQGTLTGTTNVNGNVKIMYSSAMISKLYSLSAYQVSSWIDQ
jgi:type IV pilus assembly PilX-like protein